MVPAGDPAPTDGLRWVEGAFDTLRQEVEGLRTALAKEQALVATLVGTEKPEAGPDAESMQAIIDVAVRKAVRRESVALSDTVTAVVEGLRRDMEAARTASEATLATLQQTLDEVAAATAAIPAELGQHDAGNRKAFKTALSQELQPVIEVVAESVAQSDYELKAISAKLDDLAVSDVELGAAIADLSAVVEALADEAGVEFDETDGEPPPPPPLRPVPTPLGRRAADPRPPAAGCRCGSRDPRANHPTPGASALDAHHLAVAGRDDDDLGVGVLLRRLHSSSARAGGVLRTDVHDQVVVAVEVGRHRLAAAGEAQVERLHARTPDVGRRRGRRRHPQPATARSRPPRRSRAGRGR